MMKKVLIFPFLLFTAGRSLAQTLDDISKLVNGNKAQEAKIAIDKYMADPKNATNYQGWYYKGRIYNAVSRDPATPKADSYTDKLEAFEAFKKSQLYKDDILMTAEGHKSYLDLYLGFYDLGAQAFNAKDFTASYNAFSKAQEVEDYILAKNYVYDEVKL